MRSPALLFLLPALHGTMTPSCEAQPTPVAAALIARLQPILDAVSLEHNVSFSVGVMTPDTGGSVQVFAGANDRAAGTPLTGAGRFPVGSVTKSWTATAIMRLWEQGLVDIDAPVGNYVDDIMTRLNGTTMLQLWNNDTTVHNVTARLLMGMRGGLHDYDDEFFRNFTLNTQTDWWTPFDILHQLDKSWVCAPGTCGVCVVVCPPWSRAAHSSCSSRRW
jgi:D-alanyl-D-alanine carboxypeptidase